MGEGGWRLRGDGMGGDQYCYSDALGEMLISMLGLGARVISMNMVYCISPRREHIEIQYVGSVQLLLEFHTIL